MEHCGGGSVGDLLQVCVCWLLLVLGVEGLSLGVVGTERLRASLHLVTLGQAVWVTCCRFLRVAIVRGVGVQG